MKGKLMMLLACLFMGASMVTAQTSKVTGLVIGAEDGEPVIGASVAVKGVPTLGAITDIDGKFVIENLPSSAKTLVVSYVGMTTQEVTIHPYVKVIMQSDEEVLEEVVIQAFGTAKKAAFTGSASVVSAAELADVQVASITDALAGKSAGVQLVSSNGAPGSSATIRIRGFSSINAGQDPLIIVDGAPYDGDMANINTADVESMTVLKDAASNALYGARGANGVIMITTKKAKQGKAVVSFDAKYGVNTRALQNYNVITDPAMYYETHYKALANYYESQGMTASQAWAKANQNLFSEQGNGGLGYNVYTIPEGEYLIGRDGKLNPNATLGNIVNWEGEDYLVSPDNWQDAAYRKGARQEYNFSVSSANDKSSFFASIGYLDNEGITAKSDMERLTGRLRADYQAKKWLKVGGNISFTKFEGNSLGENGSSGSTANIWAFTSQIAPIYPLYVKNPDGSIKVDQYGNQILDYGNAKYGLGGNAGFSRPFLSDANALQDVLLNTRNYEGNAAVGSGFADITFLPGLVLTINGTYSLDETRYTYIYNPYYGQFRTTGGTISKQHSRTYAYNLQQLLNYTTHYGLNNINIMLGHEYYNNKGYLLYASKHQMFSPDDFELDRAVVDNSSSGSYRTEYNNEGFFGRLQYDYDNRIFASASVRRDASSRFHPDHRWGTFWSAGAAWLLSQERWFNVDWVDMLKVKASIGSQGNDNIGNFLYADRYDISNSDGKVGVAFGAKGTKDITWETNTNFNAGFEFELFKRLSGGIEYYKRNTTDMLFSFSVAPSAGYTSYFDNVGDLFNDGIELELSYDIIKKRNINWNVFGNISTLRNRITMLHDDNKTTSYFDLEGNEYFGYTSGSFFIAEGASMYSWRLKEFAGVDPVTGQSMWYKDVEELDANGDPTGKMLRETTTKYADATYYVNNKSTIPAAFGGFGTSIYAYGFDISANFSYQIGGWQYDGTYASFMSTPLSNSTGSNIHVDALQAWTPENKSTTIPRWQFDDTYSAGSSTRFLTKASYLNIENIAVGYTFPAEWTRKAQINSLRLYVTADNVWYWSARQGFDPRQSFSSSTNATTYSPMRSVSAGISLKF
ncbi:MAG: TonB-dependent receptor [Bacteroidales bacterium]|nr:TonB-dependent receptor [Bacteroidales bacterium]